MQEEFRILTMPSFDGTKIVTYEWSPSVSPKGVLLIVHGMSEHAKRYNEFALNMNKKGLLVFAFDLRGHGLTAGSPEDVFKHINGRDIFNESVGDIKFFADMLIKKYNLPLCVLGHSYGSFLTQGFIESYNKHTCAVLTGSAYMRDVLTMFGGIVAGTTKTFKGGEAKGKMIFKLSFGSYGKGFENGNWLTRDNTIAKIYLSDPYCGACPTADFYKSFFAGLNQITKPSEIAKINKEIPLLITSGSSDPVGGKNASLVYKLYNKYAAEGLQKLEFKIWDDARHEILNEINRKEIRDYIADFVLENL